jgi:ParB-like chromosome segregation protein Spo0J
MTNDLQPTGEVHPFADLFPMLGDDALADLAADIKQNGLIHPIVLDKQGAVVDGRNRGAACKLAGVAPRYVTLNGQDPVLYIIGANLNRRELTQGQKAALLAEAGDFLKKRDGSVTQKDLAKAGGVSAPMLTYAVVVKEETPRVLLKIIAGEAELTEEYPKALAIRQGNATKEQAARRYRQRLNKLRDAAPDLAAQVEERKLRIEEAEGALEARQREAKRERQTVTRNLLQALLYLDPPPDGVEAKVSATVAQLDPGLVSGMDIAASGRADFSSARLRAASAVLLGIATALEDRTNGNS